MKLSSFSRERSRENAFRSKAEGATHWKRAAIKQFVGRVVFSRRWKDPLTYIQLMVAFVALLSLLLSDVPSFLERMGFEFSASISAEDAEAGAEQGIVSTNEELVGSRIFSGYVEAVNQYDDDSLCLFLTESEAKKESFASVEVPSTLSLSAGRLIRREIVVLGRCVGMNADRLDIVATHVKVK